MRTGATLCGTSNDFLTPSSYSLRCVMRSWRIYKILSLLVAILAWCGSRPLGTDDASAIRNVLEHYRASWLSNDPDGVRSCFTQDAVLMPHHGLEPIVGLKAINEFWFPRTNTKTTILKFARTIDEIGVDGTFAYARGHGEVVWRVEDNRKTEDWRTGGTYMAILKKQGSGKWLISHLIWDDVPNERKK
jgi:uncharacterized protein (TIGR02246 family)